MIILEMPMIFSSNCDEIEDCKSKGMELPNEEYEISKATIYLSDSESFFINESSKKNDTTVLRNAFGGEDCTFWLDMPYELVKLAIEEAIRKNK